MLPRKTSSGVGGTVVGGGVQGLLKPKASGMNCIDWENVAHVSSVVGVCGRLQYCLWAMKQNRTGLSVVLLCSVRNTSGNQSSVSSDESHLVGYFTVHFLRDKGRSLSRYFSRGGRSWKVVASCVSRILLVLLGMQLLLLMLEVMLLLLLLVLLLLLLLVE